MVLCDWKYRKKRAQIDQRLQKTLKAKFENSSSAILEETITQLDEYFSGKRKDFDIKIFLVGTEFQKSVWNELLKIPFGESLSYLALSKKLKNEKAIRAVASANGANAISIIIPCHRVIGSNQELSGYAGGIKAKQALLTLEQTKGIKHQIRLF